MKKAIIIFCLVFLGIGFTYAQENNEVEVQIKYFLEEQYVYYLDQNPTVPKGYIIDENKVSHRVYKSLQEIYEEVETGSFELKDDESRVFYLYSLDINEIKYKSPKLYIDTKNKKHTIKSQ